MVTTKNILTEENLLSGKWRLCLVVRAQYSSVVSKERTLSKAGKLFNCALNLHLMVSVRRYWKKKLILKFKMNFKTYNAFRSKAVINCSRIICVPEEYFNYALI